MPVNRNPAGTAMLAAGRAAMQVLRGQNQVRFSAGSCSMSVSVAGPDMPIAWSTPGTRPGSAEPRFAGGKSRSRTCRLPGDRAGRIRTVWTFGEKKSHALMVLLQIGLHCRSVLHTIIADLY